MDSGADSLLAGESGAAAAACSGSGSVGLQPLKGVAGAVGLGPDAANTSLGGGGGRGGSALGAACGSAGWWRWCSSSVITMSCWNSLKVLKYPGPGVHAIFILVWRGVVLGRAGLAARKQSLDHAWFRAATSGNI